jgi:SAM-dependent methyltransferase
MHTLLPSPQPAVGNWRPYFAAVCNRDASFLARTAVGHVDFRGSALDLGSGTLNDSKLFLETGFNRVEAVDGSSDALPYAERLLAAYRHRFRMTQSLFQDFDFGEGLHDLIHSNFALPYHGPLGFDAFINRIKASIRDSGVFSGTFFGCDDDWYMMRRNFAFVTKEKLKELFSDFKVIELKELRLDGSFYDGNRKHWHYFRVIAKKSDSSL